MMMASIPCIIWCWHQCLASIPCIIWYTLILTLSFPGKLYYWHYLYLILASALPGILMLLSIPGKVLAYADIGIIFHMSYSNIGIIFYLVYSNIGISFTLHTPILASFFTWHTLAWGQEKEVGVRQVLLALYQVVHSWNKFKFNLKRHRDRFQRAPHLLDVLNAILFTSDRRVFWGLVKHRDGRWQ